MSINSIGTNSDITALSAACLDSEKIRRVADVCPVGIRIGPRWAYDVSRCLSQKQELIRTRFAYH